jgi:cyclopropane fatty-acyl-phospholipid synthase-like methyltransferase
MPQWYNYYEQVGYHPNSFVARSLHEFVTGRGVALDLGAGNMRDSRYLLSHGFERVVAVDSSMDAKAYHSEGVEFCISRIEDYEIEPDTFDYVVSCNTLFYLDKESVQRLFRKVWVGLRPHGIFAGNLLGSRDDCVRSISPLFDFEREEVEALCEGFTVRAMEEVAQTSTFPYIMSHQWCLALQKP